VFRISGYKEYGLLLDKKVCYDMLVDLYYLSLFRILTLYTRSSITPPPEREYNSIKSINFGDGLNLTSSTVLLAMLDSIFCRDILSLPSSLECRLSM
jgi:hypothetical protein